MHNGPLYSWRDKAWINSTGMFNKGKDFMKINLFLISILPYRYYSFHSIWTKTDSPLYSLRNNLLNVFYKLDFLCLCAISSEKADYQDEVEITSLFNIPQASNPRKRQEYKGLFIHSIKYQFVSIWFPGVQHQMRHGPQWAVERESFPHLTGEKEMWILNQKTVKEWKEDEGRLKTEGKAQGRPGKERQ